MILTSDVNFEHHLLTKFVCLTNIILGTASALYVRDDEIAICAFDNSTGKGIYTYLIHMERGSEISNILTYTRKITLRVKDQRCLVVELYICYIF